MGGKGRELYLNNNTIKKKRKKENGDFALYFYVGVRFRPKTKKSFIYINLDPIQNSINIILNTSLLIKK